VLLNRYITGPLTTLAQKPLAVAGKGGVPASGITGVALTIAAV
jgi:hypothetical protein